MLIKRKQIAIENKLIGSELAKLQELMLKYSHVDWLKGEEMQEYLATFDLINLPKIEISTVDKILSLTRKYHRDTFTKELSEKLIELLTELKVKQLIIITPLKEDYFGNRANPFELLKRSNKKLEEIVNDTRYEEAFKIKLKDLQLYVEIFFWIVRCGGPEEVLFFDTDGKVSFSICKHGNIHLTELGKERLKNCDSLSKDWIELGAGGEYDNIIDEEN